MSKKATDNQQQPAHIAELLLNGKALFAANTPEEVAAMVKDIPADCSFSTGAIGKNPDTGAFTLRVDLITK